MRLGAAALVAVLLGAVPARSLDTVEPSEQGAGRVDFLIGYDGLGAGNQSGHTVSSEMLFGWGVLSRLTAYLGTAVEADGHLSLGRAIPRLGVYGAPLDTDHVDLDLLLDASTAGPLGYQLLPATELNLDLEPDRAFFGFYVRAGLPLYGDNDINGAPRASFHVEVTAGAYLTLADDHQLLVAYDMQLADWDVGGAALGYNVRLSDAVELITQVRVDIPADDEDLTVGLGAGIIGTIPP